MSSRGEHKHAELTALKREVVVVVAAACKRAASESLECKPRDIIRPKLKDANVIDKPNSKRVRVISSGDDNSLFVPCPSHVACLQIIRSIYRAKRKVLPTLPKSGAEAVAQFETLQAMTAKNEKFSFVDVQTGIIAFTCATNLR